ncbi:MAG TPA: hypothetical protein VGU46_09685 [Acidobacteriaceae bacterium]|nr:hypothetical protein [Acidobacteriaceae bacterium]
MRTSITLQDDAYSLASVYASARRITLGKAISELVLKAQNVPAATPDILWSDSGLPMFPPVGNVITPERIKELESELE